MSKRGFGVVAVAAALLLSVSVGAVATGAAWGSARHAGGVESSHHQAARVSAMRGAALTASERQVDEGDRYTLTATIKSRRQATKATLQKWKPSLYGWDAPKWESVKTARVRGGAKVKFAVVATGENTERYRVTVAYQKAKPFTSKPVRVTVWRWIPLKQYSPYYATGGAIFGTTTINGHAYNGWGAASYSHVGAWESRFTPGRHCKSFHGVLGIADISADGSSGAINVTADDTVIYQSPSLTPGMDLPVTVPLAKPYRLGIQLFDTTPGGTTGRDTVESWPVIGDPALLCTGV